jgi:predicted RNA-binding protein with PIN domain
MKNYQKEVMAYTKGFGRLFCSLEGYEPCHNQEDIIGSIGYDSERDIENPTGSVFCAHGAGFLVRWDEVKDYMHVEGLFQKKEASSEEIMQKQRTYSEEQFISVDEIDKIINSTFYANQGKKTEWKRSKTIRDSYYESTSYIPRTKEVKEEYLLVDGYNIIFAWPELQVIAEENMDGARTKLLDIMSNYQGIRKCKIIVVFDAYRVQEHKGEIIEYHNIHMVYTREAQTADQFIEKFAHDNNNKYNIVVATSDGLQQIIVRGAGCSLLSARELKIEIEVANERIKEEYVQKQQKEHNYLFHSLSDDAKKQMEELIKKENEKA